MRPVIITPTAILASLIAFTALGTNARAVDVDYAAAESGAFEVTFTACTADSHPALVRLQMTTYSPVDPVPGGYAQATKEEVAAAATEVLAYYMSPFIGKAADVMVSGDSFLSDVAMEEVTIKDEQGKDMKAGLMAVSMSGVKEVLMKDGKYSGMGVGYPASHVFVNATATCAPAAR